MRHLVAAGLALVAVAAAIGLGDRARRWNEELAVASPLAARPPMLDDPHTPRLARRVVLVVIDGLGAAEAELPFLGELGRLGAAGVARVPYPTISRPNYVTILTGVPPRDSGVRANRVVAPVAVDTAMDRVRAAGLRVATASDFGSLASLFLRNTATLAAPYLEDGERLRPAPPVTWPFDDARRTESLDALGRVIAELAASDAAFVPVLVLDVDRAGHASGVGRAYRAAAAAVDRMLRGALAGVDLARDAVIITADHGHVAPGGHGGREPEVSRVPLVLAGAGIVPGAVARDPALTDVAPTVAALLGLPAPGHAEGRALVELLRLDAGDAERRAAIDAARGRTMAALGDAARAELTVPDPGRLALALAGLALAGVAGFALARRGALILQLPGALVGAAGIAAMVAVTALVTRGRWSPSYVPSLPRAIEFGAIGAVAAIALQVLATARVLRRSADRVAAASGAALVGLSVGLGGGALVRAWFAPPHLEPPSPFWMVAIPAIDLAAATGAAAIAISIAITVAHSTSRSRALRHARHPRP